MLNIVFHYVYYLSPCSIRIGDAKVLANLSLEVFLHRMYVKLIVYFINDFYGEMFSQCVISTRTKYDSSYICNNVRWDFNTLFHVRCCNVREFLINCLLGAQHFYSHGFIGFLFTCTIIGIVERKFGIIYGLVYYLIGMITNVLSLLVFLSFPTYSKFLVSTKASYLNLIFTYLSKLLRYFLNKFKQLL